MPNLYWSFLMKFPHFHLNCSLNFKIENWPSKIRKRVVKANLYSIQTFFALLNKIRYEMLHQTFKKKKWKINEGRKLALINHGKKTEVNVSVYIYIVVAYWIILQLEQSIFLFTSDAVCIEIKIEMRSWKWYDSLKNFSNLETWFICIHL